MKTPSLISDEQLIQLTINGDNNALAELVLRHKDRLYTSICLLVKDKYLAEDIFQDTFIKAINTIIAGDYNDQGKFLSWIVRIAHNIRMDHFRKVKRNPVFKTANDQNLFDTINFSEPGADDKMVRSEKHDKVREMLYLLPEEQREVVILRHYADLSFKEIASATNCSINTALGRMRYGLMNLNKMMGEKQVAL
jgi:RNA polymerase sigma-70 factor (ECF subfamily)